MVTVAALPDNADIAHIAAIDAALAKGAWWRDLFRELSRAGMARVEALDLKSPTSLWRVAQDFERFARAVRLAAVAGLRLGGFLRGLADLRRLPPGELAAARARAKAQADARAARRDQARARAEARRAARAAEIREKVVQIIQRERREPRDRDTLVEALDRRLSVDPALVALDDLPLRDAVIRICKDLGIVPDWRRWEAGDWRFLGSQAGAAPRPSLPLPPPPKQHLALAKPEPPPRKIAPPRAVAEVARRLTRRADTGVSRGLRSVAFASPWQPPRPG